MFGCKSRNSIDKQNAKHLRHPLFGQERIGKKTKQMDSTVNRGLTVYHTIVYSTLKINISMFLKFSSHSKLAVYFY